MVEIERNFLVNQPFFKEQAYAQNRIAQDIYSRTRPNIASSYKGTKRIITITGIISDSGNFTI